jgi:CRISPR-associated protein Cmr6
MRPLYKELAAAPRLESCPADANVGLWFDKFFDGWDAQWGLITATDVAPGGKVAFLKRLVSNFGTNRAIGNKALIEEVATRIASLTHSRKGALQRLNTASRLVAGMGNPHPLDNGLQWHRTLGVPYLPASSLKGIARSWARFQENGDSDNPRRIFGEPEAIGDVAFLDGLPCAPFALEVDVMTPHYYGGHEEPDNYAGDWHDPIPIVFAAIASGQQFQFATVPLLTTDIAVNDAKMALSWLIEALCELGAGAKTSVGYGRFASAVAVAMSAPINVPGAGHRYKPGDQVKLRRIEDAKGQGRFFAQADDGLNGSSPTILPQNRRKAP